MNTMNDTGMAGVDFLVFLMIGFIWWMDGWIGTLAMDGWMREVRRVGFVYSQLVKSQSNDHDSI